MVKSAAAVAFATLFCPRTMADTTSQGAAFICNAVVNTNRSSPERF